MKKLILITALLITTVCAAQLIVTVDGEQYEVYKKKSIPQYIKFYTNNVGMLEHMVITNLLYTIIPPKWEVKTNWNGSGMGSYTLKGKHYQIGLIESNLVMGIVYKNTTNWINLEEHTIERPVGKEIVITTLTNNSVNNSVIYRAW